MASRGKLIGFLGALAIHTSAQAGAIRFDNGYWFTGTSFEPRTVYVDKGRLASSPPPGPVRSIDLANGYVVPPLCEAHNHNLGGEEPEGAIIRRYLEGGIYYVNILSNLPRFTAATQSNYNRPDSVDVQFANGGLTAPGGHPIPLRERLLSHGAYPGFTRETLADHAYFAITDSSDFEEKWPKILSHRPDLVKLFLVHSEEYAIRRNDPAYAGRRGLDPALLPAIVENVHERGLRAFAHVETAHDFRVAIASNVDVIAHVPGNSEPSSHLTPTDARRAAEAGVTVITTAAKFNSLAQRDPERYRAAMAAIRQNLALLHEAGVTLAVGSDLHDSDSRSEAELLRDLDLFSPAELLSMWTRNCAASVFPARQIGHLETGAEASFLVLNGNPLIDWSALGRIELRYKDGNELILPERRPTDGSGP